MLGDTPKALKRRRRVKGAKANGRLWKHSTLADIEGLLNRSEIEQMLCFTLVRNPWDRMVSYYHWLQKQSFSHPAVDASKRLGFSEFLRAPIIAAPMAAQSSDTYMQASDGTAYSALYIKLENFAEDAAPLFSHLGFELSLPQSNASGRESDYRGYYCQDDAALVARLCARDIATFGYCFDTAF